MKAIVLNAYGRPEFLTLKDLDKPAIKENQILVRVLASSVNAGDLFTVLGSPWMIRFSVGFPRPKDYVPGWDAAGRVEEVGSKVTRFRPGDEVFGGCEHAFAEYVSGAEDRFAHKPANLTFEQSAALPTAAITALLGLRDQAKLQPDHQVLITGASGGVGLFTVQIGKLMGAQVTGVCSTAKVDLVRSAGADRVIDYTQEDFTQGEQRYDLIFDNAGNRTFSDMKRVLKPNGLLQPNSGFGGMRLVFKSFFMSLFRRYGRPYLAVPKHQDLLVLKEYCESEKVTPIIDQTFPLSETARAVGVLASRQARGKLIITMND